MFTPLVQPNPNASSSSSSTAPRTRIESVEAPEYTRIHSSPPKTLFLWRILHRIYPNFQARCFMNDPIFSKTEFTYYTIASWNRNWRIYKGSTKGSTDPQTQELLILYLASYTSSSERASIHPTRALVLGTTIDSLHATLPHRREDGISKRQTILLLLVTSPTKKFLSPNCCYGTHMQACRSRTSGRWSSEDHAQEITTVRTTAKPWDVAAAPPPLPPHHPEDFCARLDPKHKFFSKSEEQWTRIQFFFAFFFLIPRVDPVHLLPASSLSELLRSPRSNI